MDRKVKQRILGVFVILGLAVILLPLFHKGSNGNETSNVQLVQAPGFPEQATQQPQTAALEQVNESTRQEPQAAVDNSVNQQPDDTIRALKPSIVSSEQTVNPLDASEAQTEVQPKTAGLVESDLVQIPIPTEQATVKEASIAAVEPEATVTKKPEPTVKIAKATKPHATHKTLVASKKASVPAPISDYGLAELKNPAWVIQLGSFRNKSNALRLVNQLRANGYPAFIQQISTALGDNTRVFVGPESKPQAARSLALRLKTDMNLNGIVISYKPLQL